MPPRPSTPSISNPGTDGAGPSPGSGRPAGPWPGWVASGSALRSLAVVSAAGCGSPGAAVLSTGGAGRLRVRSGSGPVRVAGGSFMGGLPGTGQWSASGPGASLPGGYGIRATRPARPAGRAVERRATTLARVPDELAGGEPRAGAEAPGIAEPAGRLGRETVRR